MASSSKIAKLSLSAAGFGSPMSTPGGGVIYPADVNSMLFTGAYASSAVVTTQNSTAGAFSGGGGAFVDFIIAGAGTGPNLFRADQMYLEVQVSNTNVADAMILTALTNWFGVEMLINNQTAVSYRGQYGTLAMQEKINTAMTVDEYETAASYNADVYFWPTATIAAASSATYLLPIHYIFPEITKLPLCCVTDELKIRFITNPVSAFIASTSTAIASEFSLVQMRIVEFGMQIPDESTQMIKSLLISNQLRIPTSLTISRDFPIGVLAVTSESGPQVINLKGWLLSFSVYTNPTAFTTNESKLTNYVYKPVQFFTSNAQPIFSGIDSYIATAVEAHLYGKSSMSGGSMYRRMGYVSPFDTEHRTFYSWCGSMDFPSISEGHTRHGMWNLSSTESIRLIQDPAGVPLVSASVACVNLNLNASLFLTAGKLTYQVSSST